MLLSPLGFSCGGRDPCTGNLSLLTTLFFFFLKEGAGKLFMGLGGSVHFNLILIYFFEEIHQNPHVALDLVSSV